MRAGSSSENTHSNQESSGHFMPCVRTALIFELPEPESTSLCSVPNHYLIRRTRKKFACLAAPRCNFMSVSLHKYCFRFGSFDTPMCKTWLLESETRFMLHKSRFKGRILVFCCTCVATDYKYYDWPDGKRLHTNCQILRVPTCQIHYFFHQCACFDHFRASSK